MAISKLPILHECVIQTDALEWVYLKRQGINKQTGKENPQLELRHKKLPAKEVAKKLIAQLQLVRHY